MAAAPLRNEFEVEEFTLGHFKARSDAFIFAKPHNGSGLIYLPHGEAHALRPYAKTRLECPEPGCTSPTLTTVSREPNGRRDGFRHLVRPSVNHEPEGGPTPASEGTHRSLGRLSP